MRPGPPLKPHPPMSMTYSLAPSCLLGADVIDQSPWQYLFERCTIIYKTEYYRIKEEHLDLHYNNIIMFIVCGVLL